MHLFFNLIQIVMYWNKSDKSDNNKWEDTVSELAATSQMEYACISILITLFINVFV